MYPRLKLLHELLSELLSDNGSLWITLDDNEMHHARSILDEIFAEHNFVATIIWHKVYSPKNTARHFSSDHDYVLVYAKNADDWQPNLLPRTEEMEARYINPDYDPRGPWKPRFRENSIRVEKAATGAKARIDCERFTRRLSAALPR